MLNRFIQEDSDQICQLVGARGLGDYLYLAISTRQPIIDWDEYELEMGSLHAELCLLPDRCCHYLVIASNPQAAHTAAMHV